MDASCGRIATIISARVAVDRAIERSSRLTAACRIACLETIADVVVIANRSCSRQASLSVVTDFLAVTKIFVVTFRIVKTSSTSSQIIVTDGGWVAAIRRRSRHATKRDFAILFAIAKVSVIALNLRMHAPGLGIAAVHRAGVFIVTRRRPANGMTIVIINARHTTSCLAYLDCASIIVIVAERIGVFVDACAGCEVARIVRANFSVVTLSVGGARRQAGIRTFFTNGGFTAAGIRSVLAADLRIAGFLAVAKGPVVTRKRCAARTTSACIALLIFSAGVSVIAGADERVVFTASILGTDIVCARIIVVTVYV